jgi:hypothetical protein
MADTHSVPTEDRSVALWLWFAMLAFWPRLFILGFWIFSDNLSRAFSSWITPTIGFFIAPSTTFAYLVMWSVGSDRVSGAEWLVVAIGVMLDLWMWGALQAIRRGS